MLWLVMAQWWSRAVGSSLWSVKVIYLPWKLCSALSLSPDVVCVCESAQVAVKHTHAHCNTCRAYKVSDHSVFLSSQELKAANTCVSKAVGGLWRVKGTEGCWNCKKCRLLGEFKCSVGPAWVPRWWWWAGRWEVKLVSHNFRETFQNH